MSVSNEHGPCYSRGDSTYPIHYGQSNNRDQIQTFIFNMSIKAQSVAHAQLLGLGSERFHILNTVWSGST